MNQPWIAFIICLDNGNLVVELPVQDTQDELTSKKMQ